MQIEIGGSVIGKNASWKGVLDSRLLLRETMNGPKSPHQIHGVKTHDRSVGKQFRQDA